MRKMSILPILLLMLAGHGIQITGDMSKAAVKEKAGRVLELEEVLRIQDAQDDYYFKSPHGFRVAPDGCLFVLDDEQFLKFDADGRFIANLYKKGQGPGEFEGIKGYVFADDTLIVLQLQPTKIVKMTRDGEFIQEFRPEVNASKLLAVHDGRYVTARYSNPPIDKVGEEPSIFDADWTVGYLLEGEKAEECDLRFSTRWYAKRIGARAIIADHIADFIAEPFMDRYLILSHTGEYRLKLFDMARNQVVQEFGRDYRRIRLKQDKSGQIEIRPEVFRLAPPVDFLNDVQQLFIRGDNIWVMTSTVESRKGILFDVFDRKGEHIDTFYLPCQPNIKAEGLEGLPLTFHEDFLYVAEYDEDEIPSIVKYRMISRR